MDLFGIKAKATSEAAGAVGGLVESVGKAAKDIRAAITGKEILDPEAQAELDLKAQEIEASILMEATNASVFVSGWRPMIGWICAIALGLNFLVFPLARAFGASPPGIGTDELFPMVTALLGLGTLRTYEKAKGIARQ